MVENPRRGRQARNFTTNVSKILDLKSSSEQIFFRKLSFGAPAETLPYFPAKLTRSLRRKENLNVPHYNTHGVVNTARFCGLDSIHTSCGNKWYHLTKSWRRVKMKTLEHVIYGVGALLLGGSYFFQEFLLYYIG